MINERKRLEGSFRVELDQTEVFLTEQRLAARHQRSVKTLRNDRVSGGYVPFLKIGRSVRYRLSDVLTFERAALKRSTSGVETSVDERQAQRQIRVGTSIA
jgi:hypothetical protein